MECFMFTVNKIISASDGSAPYSLTEFTKTHFIDLLTSSIFTGDSNLHNTCLYRLFGDVLLEENADANTKVSTIVWNGFFEYLQTALKSGEARNDEIVLERIFNLIQAFVCPESTNTKIKKKELKFQDGGGYSSAEKQLSATNRERLNNEDVLKLIPIICRHVLVQLDESFGWVYVNFMVKMVGLCDDKNVWNNILHPENLRDFIFKKTLVWLKMSESRDCATVTQMLFTMLTWMDKSAVDAILCKATEVSNIISVTAIIQRATPKLRSHLW